MVGSPRYRVEDTMRKLIERRTCEMCPETIERPASSRADDKRPDGWHGVSLPVFAPLKKASRSRPRGTPRIVVKRVEICPRCAEKIAMLVSDANGGRT